MRRLALAMPMMWFERFPRIWLLLGSALAAWLVLIGLWLGAARLLALFAGAL